MAFWSAEKLISRNQTEDIIQPFYHEQIDCAAYTLTIGDEVYVSPTIEEHNSQNRTSMNLHKGKTGFTIPSGQFAFLITSELVKIPHDSIGLISIKAGIKFRGLVNVSGFHVDAGYYGKLMFSVFNAGPSTIHLKQDDDAFLIWFADLDRTSKEVKPPKFKTRLKKEEKPNGYTAIPASRLNQISGGILSLEVLNSKNNELKERIRKIEKEHAIIRWLGLLLLGSIITAFTIWFKT